MADQQGTRELIAVCPECDGPSIDRRKTKTPTYRCRNCTATFERPTERPKQPPDPPTISIETRNDAIRQAAEELGEPLGVSEYDDWQRTHDDAPSRLAISNRFGWTTACFDAGVTPVQRPYQDPEHLFAALFRIRDQLGEWPTTNQYTDHRRQTDPSETWFYDDDETPESWPELIAAAKERASERE